MAAVKDEDFFALCQNGTLEEVGRAIKSGANVNAKNGYGVTPLMRAVFENDLEIIELLIKKGADVNAQNENGYSVLMAALDHEKPVEVIHLLRQNGADVKAKNKEGQTALDVFKDEYSRAQGTERYEALETLLLGADLPSKTVAAPAGNAGDKYFLDIRQTIKKK
jgi:hypothetical protein